MAERRTNTMEPELIGGRYRVGAALGRGGMGTVWSCRDELLHRDVAVKQVGLLPGESVTDAERAYREARSSAALNHAHVVTVFDMVDDGGRLWMVMEQVPGRSLAEIIETDGPLDPALVAEIGAQVADGLAAAHAAGMVHRDVKPGNVLVRTDGVAKISDFGIARRHGDPALTGTGLVTGTPSYFSPEMARGEEPGPPADVWALGATLYAALEGEPPYPTQGNPVAVLHRIATTDPAPPTRAGFLAEPLRRMLDRDPSSRWTMADAAHVLRRLARDHRAGRTLATAEVAEVASAGPDTLVTEPETDEPEPEPEEERPEQPPEEEDYGETRRRRGVLGPLLAGFAVLLVAALVGLWLLAQQDPGSERTAPDASSPGTSSSAPSKARASSASASPSASTTRSTSPSPASDAATMEQFVRDYYARAPGGNDTAWQMLGPQLKAQGRSSYDSFWRGIASVDVLQAAANPSADTVDVTLVYHRTDGSTSTERKREGLIRKNGGYLLDTDVARG